MDEVMSGLKFPGVYCHARIEMEQAKKAAAADRSFTCFKGVGSISVSSLARCTWLGQEQKMEDYV